MNPFRKFPLQEIRSPHDLGQALEYLLRILPEKEGEELSEDMKNERMRVLAMVQFYKNKDVYDKLLGENGILPSDSE
jgi:hypothetical protein